MIDDNDNDEYCITKRRGVDINLVLLHPRGSKKIGIKYKN